MSIEEHPVISTSTAYRLWLEEENKLTKLIIDDLKSRGSIVKNNNLNDMENLFLDWRL